MKKILLFSLGFLATLSSPLQAQFRLDPVVSVPLVYGVHFGADSFSTGTGGYIFPVPEFQFHYVFNAPPLRFGVGARLFTAVLMSMITPNVFAEVDLGPFVVNGSVGGLYYGVFGLVSGSGTGSVILPEASLEYKVSDWCRLGAGVLFFGDYHNIDQYNVYAGFVRVRFPISFQ